MWLQRSAGTQALLPRSHAVRCYTNSSHVQPSPCASPPSPPCYLLQQELHEMAGGDGPEFDLQEHLPKTASTGQQRQQAAAAAEQGPVAMAE